LFPPFVPLLATWSCNRNARHDRPFAFPCHDLKGGSFSPPSPRLSVFAGSCVSRRFPFSHGLSHHPPFVSRFGLHVLRASTSFLTVLRLRRVLFQLPNFLDSRSRTFPRFFLFGFLPPHQASVQVPFPFRSDWTDVNGTVPKWMDARSLPVASLKHFPFSCGLAI